MPLLIGHVAFHAFDAFAHNDDFLYARCAEILVHEGRYQHVSQHGLLAASVASHCVWGALVCMPIGFSYDHLHWSVAILAWLGSIGVFATARELGGSVSMSFVAALAMMVSPYCYGMSFTFMTDVTAMSFAALALAGYVRGVQRDSFVWLVAGAMAASLAMWSRQTHLCVIAVPAIALGAIAWQGRQTRKAVWQLVVGIGIPLLSFALFESGWLVPGNEARAAIVDVQSYDAQWLRQNALFGYAGGLLIGFALLPMLPMLLADRLEAKDVSRRAWFVGGLALLIWGGAFIASSGRAMITQATGYILYNAHLGPILLGDQNDSGRWSDIGGVSWPPLVWQGVTFLSLLALALAFVRAVGCFAPLIEPIDEAKQRQAWLRMSLLGCTVAAAIGLLLYVEMIYDRYWMLLYPMVFAWLGGTLKVTHRGYWVATGLIALALFAMSFVLVHDFLAWNHQRHAQVAEWLEQGLEPEQFDAGNGINGWFRSAEDHQTFAREGDSSHFWRGHATHALTIGPRDGWRVVGKRRWRSWAIASDCELYVLTKED